MTKGRGARVKDTRKGFLSSLFGMQDGQSDLYTPPSLPPSRDVYPCVRIIRYIGAPLPAVRRAADLSPVSSG